jgi:two-component system heavy metal sensor histidine kinase CusS
MRSLGRTLLVGTTVGTTVVLAAAGAVLYLLVRAGLFDEFDRSLVDKARTLASAIEQEEGKLDLEFEELDLYEFQSADRLGYLQVSAADGAVLYRSPSLGGADLEAVAGLAESPPVRWIGLPRGQRGRAVSVTLTPKIEAAETDKEGGVGRRRDPSAGPVTLVMARDTARIDALLFRLGILLALVGLLAVAVSAGVLCLVVRRSLRPVRRLAARIGQLGQEDLSARIDATDVPAELHVVTARLNDLLHRLEAAFQRERAFSADVAHELRTPLAGLRSTVEVTLSRLRTTEDYQKALADCLRVTAQMQAMVEKLLELASFETGEVRVELEPVLPNELIRAAWGSLQQSAAARRLQVQWNLGPPQPVVTDSSLLDLILRNVLENAVEYADEGGTVTIETAGKDHQAEIRVSNTGATLSQEEAEHVFDRFWRGDAARSGTGVHAGLGLSLVSRATAILHGQIRVESRTGGEFELTVILPRQIMCE